jgi:signal transduction histidine kinase
MTKAAATTGATSRVDWIWLALPYVLLALSTTLTWTAGDLSTGEVPWSVGTSLAVLGWHTWWAVLHRQWLEAALMPMTAYYLGLVGLTALLLHLSFNFFPLYLVCFAMAFVALPGVWAYAGVALATVVALAGPGLLTWSAQSVVVTVAGATLAAAAGWSIRALESETRQRRAALAELARTHAVLERAMADNLALRDRLVLEARQSGIATERARLAGEIHDTLAAGLAGVVSQLEALDAQLEPDHPLRGRVQVSSDIARESLQEARRSVRALRPGPLDGGSLTSALIEVVDGARRRSELPVDLRVTGCEVDVGAQVEQAILRAAQEALVNIDRHAGATAAHVTLSFVDEVIALDVTDDGVGFDPGTRGDGHGLVIMGERIEALGGTVDLDSDSDSGTGTTLTVTVPLEPAVDGSDGRR